MDITDVRKALWKAYKKEESSKYGIEGKSCEGWVSVEYPNYWECKTEDEFLEVRCLVVYSYALGPSRRHYFYKSGEDKKLSYNEWKCIDIYRKAVEIIDSWVNEV